MNKKGFTLIELLAVIVILAIIALITTPIVLNLINQSKEASNKRSVEAYAKAVEYAVIQYEYDHNGKLPADFDVIKNDVEYSNSDVKCNVAINCDTKGSVELTGCQVGSYTNNYYKYSSTKGNKGATVDDTNDAPGGNTSIKSSCLNSYSYEYKSIGSTDWGELNDSWGVYLKREKETEKKELCKIYSGGTVCIEPNKWDCDEQDNYHCVNSTGYVESKRAEFEAKGASCVLGSYWLYCHDGNNVGCSVSYDNNVICDITGGGCYIGSNGENECDNY